MFIYCLIVKQPAYDFPLLRSPSWWLRTGKDCERMLPRQQRRRRQLKKSVAVDQRRKHQTVRTPFGPFIPSTQLLQALRHTGCFYILHAASQILHLLHPLPRRCGSPLRTGDGSSPDSLPRHLLQNQPGARE